MKDEKDNGTKKKVVSLIAIIAVVAIVLGIIAGSIIGKEVKKQREYAAAQKFKTEQKDILNQEMDKLIAMDPLTDEVDQTIYTEKDYAKVESAMKTYFTEFAAVAKSVDGFATDERFAILTDQEQILGDAPDFVNTLEAINTLKTEYSADVDTISTMMTNEKIRSYLDTDLDQEYVDLYESMMTSGAAVAAETAVQAQLTISKDQIVTALDKYKTMVEYLVSTKGSWQLEDSTFMFTDQDILDQYNAYVDDFNNSLGDIE
ncbi:MAG: hypothetical protein PHQ72_08720 [Hespellia sp.]|nr:hypothetical protein [Hespellia sp.]